MDGNGSTNGFSNRMPVTGMRSLFVAAAVSVLFISCERTPENVLGKEAMASLMADLHTGEAVIDLNYSSYPNDSSRKVLKQSIYAAHGVDQELVDTSFVWYGNHIEDYIDVCDRTIEILQERQRNLASASNSQMILAGDSVTIWTGPGHMAVNGNMPSRIVAFDFSPDSTWQKGDIFMLRYTPVNSNAQIRSRLLVDYTDGTTGYVDENATMQGPRVQYLQVDSTMAPARVYGYITFPGESAYEVDSIAVVRMRHYMLPKTYLSQKRFNNGLTIERRHRGMADVSSESGHEVAGNQPASILDAPAMPARQTAAKHTPQAARRDLPESSAAREQSEHRKGAAEHKATPESRKAAANRRAAAPVQRRELKKTTGDK